MSAAEAPSGLYVHVPFCLRKCPYCGFDSFSLSERGPTGYVEAVLAEAELRAGQLTAPLETLYLGGGTPTALPAEEIGRLVRELLARRPFVPGAEVTVEANPGTLGPRMVEALRAAGVNRLSVGVQSFSDRLLERLGRAHDAREAREAVLLAAEFPRWSLDLIYAIPGETEEEALHDVAEALALGARHVSAYALTFEEGSALTRDRLEGRVRALSEEAELGLFEAVARALAGGGLGRYEVSNFAGPGEESRHNRAYWLGRRYLGMGAGAHSYVGDRREWNVRDPRKYIRRLASGALPQAGAEDLGPRERYLERLMLGLRMSEGAPLEELLELARLAGEGGFPARLERAGERGDTVVVADARVRIPPARFSIADRIIRDLA